jgi:hypothetical protein
MYDLRGGDRWIELYNVMWLVSTMKKMNVSDHDPDGGGGFRAFVGGIGGRCVCSHDLNFNPNGMMDVHTSWMSGGCVR